MAALGTMREFGEGMPADLADALRLYQLAADAGEAAGMTSLGYLYAQGKGVARSPLQARKLYQAASAKGNARAMFNLALMQIRGEGGQVDLAHAVGLLHSAADKNHAGALQELAFLYDEGRGVARNPKLAADHLLRALQAAKHEGSSIRVAPGTWTLATRRETQKLLAAKGLYKGMAHGFFNRATRTALAAAAE
jgi:TPR repeat protein